MLFKSNYYITWLLPCTFYVKIINKWKVLMIICNVQIVNTELWCLTRKVVLETDSNIKISRFSINIHCIPCLRNSPLIFSLSFLCFVCVTEWNEKNSLCRIRKVIFCCQVWMYFYFSVFSNATKKFHFKSALFPDSSKDKRIFTRPKMWNTKLQTFFT